MWSTWLSESKRPSPVKKWKVDSRKEKTATVKMWRVIDTKGTSKWYTTPLGSKWVFNIQLNGGRNLTFHSCVYYCLAWMYFMLLILLIEKIFYLQSNFFVIDFSSSEYAMNSNIYGCVINSTVSGSLNFACGSYEMLFPPTYNHTIVVLTQPKKKWCFSEQ